MNGVAFFSRCKPWGIDAKEVARQHNIVFFGYALNSGDFVPGNVNSIYDVRAFQNNVEKPDGWTKQHSKNINFINNIESHKNKIAIIPDFVNGCLWCGIVEGGFRINHSDDAYECFANAIRNSGRIRFKLEEHGMVTLGPTREVLCINPKIQVELWQGWSIAEWRRVSFMHLSAEFRKSLYGRSTYGILGGGQLRQEAYDAVDAAMKGERVSLSWTRDRSEIEQRLRFTLTPSIFESVVVSLLQLEQPELIWTHVGGSGDGGVDGVAQCEKGYVKAILQCKWQCDNRPIFQGINEDLGDNQRYLAWFFGEPLRGDYCKLNRDWLIDMILKHWRCLPLALTMRVGVPAEASV